MSDAIEDERGKRIARGVRAVREGHGANCSSIGSVIDTLFASAVIGGALFAAIAAAIAREKARVVGATPPASPPGLDRAETSPEAPPGHP
jgi:hypothetical protein